MKWKYFYLLKLIVRVQNKVVSRWICAPSAAFLCMDWEQRSLYSNKEAAATYTCWSVSNKLQQVSLRSTTRTNLGFVSWHPPLSKHRPLFVQKKFKSVSTFCFLETLHLIALCWIPIVEGQLRKTGNTSVIKLTQEIKLFTNYLWANFFATLSFSSVRKRSFPPQTSDRQLLCLVCRNIPRRQKNTAPTQTPSHLHKSSQSN